MKILEGEPEISYPCEWSYTIITQSEEEARLASFEILESEHKFTPSNKSRTGKYQSFNIKLLVESKEKRDEIFQKFQAHTLVKMVL
ncbi:MAG: HP0495 family protein [Wolinella sp.]